MNSEDWILAGVVTLIIACFAVMVAAVLSLPDNSHCDLGPPVYVSGGKGIMIPTYPFMRCTTPAQQ